MAGKFLELAFTPAVLAAQEHYHGRSRPLPPQPAVNPLTDDEMQFIAARDSFYLSSVSETGWPYVQHRGGPPGFLRAISPTRLAFADFKGNRQLLSTGNLAGNDKVCLFLMDYPQQTRLKILGHAQVLDVRQAGEWLDALTTPATRALVERIFLIEVISFDWNCHQHITPRYSAAEVNAVIAPLQKQIADLEARLNGLAKPEPEA